VNGRAAEGQTGVQARARLAMRHVQRIRWQPGARDASLPDGTD